MKLKNSPRSNGLSAGPVCSAEHGTGLRCSFAEGHLGRGVLHTHEGATPGAKELREKARASKGQFVYMGPSVRYSVWEEPTDELMVFDR